MIFESASKQNVSIKSISSSPSTDGILIELGAHGVGLHFCVESMVMSKKVERFLMFLIVVCSIEKKIVYWNPMVKMRKNGKTIVGLNGY